MRINFFKYNWTASCYKPRFKKYWSGKIWNFSVYKYGISLDFRKGDLFDWLNPNFKKNYVEHFTNQ